MKYKISQDHEKCIGCGACTQVCADNWKMGADNKAVPIKKVSELPCNKAAESGCPVHCIHVEEVK